MLFRRGLAHEHAYLTQLQSSGARVALIDDDADIEARVAETVTRCATGHNVVFQATFYDSDDQDCASPRLLRDWLEERRAEAITEHSWTPSRPAAEDGEPSEELPAEAAELVAALTDGLPGIPDVRREPEAHGRWLLARMLGSSKTHTGAEVIVALAREGLRRRDHGEQPRGDRRLAREGDAGRPGISSTRCSFG